MEDSISINPSVLQTLRTKGFKTVFLRTKAELEKFIQQNIPQECTVGIGNSVITSKTPIFELLKRKGNTLFYSWDGSTDYNRALDTFETHPMPDYYITVDSDVTSKGELVCHDTYSDTAFEKLQFPKKVIAFASVKKMVTDVKETIDSIHHHVMNAKPKDSEIIIALY